MGIAAGVGRKIGFCCAVRTYFGTVASLVAFYRFWSHVLSTLAKKAVQLGIGIPYTSADSVDSLVLVVHMPPSRSQTENGKWYG